MYCGEHWTVKPNYFYNIRGYDDLNICWVYNHGVSDWTRTLPQPLRDLLLGNDPKNEAAKNLEDFPWFRTFGQNSPHLVQLTTTQVNLLAQLSSWTVADPVNRDYIANALRIK